MKLHCDHLVLAAIFAFALSPSTMCQSESEPNEGRETWNNVFRQAQASGIKWEANEFLTKVVAGRHPGTALDIGMGQGRNALFLAENGWDVTGFDFSDEAVEQARAKAEAAGLEFEALQGDVNDFEYGVERWDLVVVMYMHDLIMPRADEIMASLVPGGLLVVEGFHRDLNMESVSGGYFGYATNELTRAFDGLRILNYEDLSAGADWGRSIAGDKPIVRLLARKPLARIEELQGAYLGQTLPGMTPELFAPGIVNTPDAVELNGVVAPGGREFLFTRIIDGELVMHRSIVEDGAWSVPQALQLYPGRAPSMAVDMTVSPDGRQLTWLGRHTSELSPLGTEPGLDLWTAERINGDWSTARLVPPPVSTAAREIYPCAVADGSLYFSSDREGSLGGSDIWRAQRLPDGSFATPVNVGAPINTEHTDGDTWVSPDETVLVMTSSRPGGHGLGDLWVSFRSEDGAWSEPRNLGPEINSPDVDFCPMGTPDGKLLFFSRRHGATPEETPGGDVYWVDALVLERFR